MLINVKGNTIYNFAGKATTPQNQRQAKPSTMAMPALITLTNGADLLQ